MKITDDPILHELSEANPVSDERPDPAQAQRVLGRVRAAAPDKPHRRQHRRRSLRVLLIPAAGVAVVIAVIATVVLAIHPGGQTTQTPATTAANGRPATLVYRTLPTPQHPEITQAVMRQTLSIMRSRVRAAGVTKARVTTRGTREIVVSFSDTRSLPDVERWIGSTAQLEFYDWEANAILPSGKSVASQLALHNPKALTISQGAAQGAGAPGLPGTGGMPLYNAVALASHQPPVRLAATLSRLGPEYYLFGTPGSRACTAWAHTNHTFLSSDAHCLLAGPESSRAELRADPLPTGVTFSEGQVLRVPQGWVVLQATNPRPSPVISPAQPTAQFFVLHDQPALSGSQLLRPTAARQDGEPIVRFGLTSSGAAAFQNLTAQIAHRGQALSFANHHLFQHFAVALDGRLLTVPQIDFTRYPDGITSTPSRAPTASIQGAFTMTTARELATQLRLGQLPVKLTLLGKPR